MRSRTQLGLRILAAVVACTIQGCRTDGGTGPATKMCEPHRLPDAECPFCHPALVAEKGLCREHGVPEALCCKCNARLAAAFKQAGDWCNEHDCPESQCFICNPSLDVAPGAPRGGVASTNPSEADVAIERAADEDRPRFERDPSVTCETSRSRIRFASMEIARRAGLALAPVQRRNVSRALTCNAEVAYDGNHYARISSRIPGIVQAVMRDVGERVVKGDVLAVVDSPELAAAKAEYLQAEALLQLALQNHSRTHDLVAKGIAGRQEDLEAETRLAESKIGRARAAQHLKTLGISESQVEEIARQEDTSPLLSIAAPFAGEIVERGAVVGETVAVAAALFAVADTRRMWAQLDVYEADVSQVRTRQPVIVQVDGLSGESFAGQVTWISTQVDPRTRTLRVRAELDNSEGLLRANMFGRARITTHDRTPMLVIPTCAVQWDGCCNIAFVRQSDLLYSPRKLRLGSQVDDYVEVRAGLEEGEQVVTQGSFMLKTEIMKSSIGAGCCEAGGKPD